MLAYFLSKKDPTLPANCKSSNDKSVYFLNWLVRDTFVKSGWMIITLFNFNEILIYLERYQGIILGKQANGWAQSAPAPGWDKVNVYENLGMAAALPVLPLNTPLIDITPDKS